MPYIRRNKNGDIDGLFGDEQFPGQEFLEESDSEVVKFRESMSNRASVERKIRMKMRDLAINALKSAGELPPDYVDPRISAMTQE